MLGASAVSLGDIVATTQLKDLLANGVVCYAAAGVDSLILRSGGPAGRVILRLAAGETFEGACPIQYKLGLHATLGAAGPCLVHIA